MVVLVASALAQTVSPPRTDPGTEVDPGGGSSEGWKFFGVPGLPTDATLGDVWASEDGHVYVWARFPSARGGALDESGEGERVPNPNEKSKSWSSVLYRFDGVGWTTFLRTPGESGGTILGSDCHHMFASTFGPQGEAQLYRFDGSSWTREVMPGHLYGRLHTLAGVPGDTWFRVDRHILRHDGSRLVPMFELPLSEPPMRGLVYLGSDGLFVMGTTGHWLYDMGAWTEVPAGFAFADVEDAWGMRDLDGLLHMYVLGSNTGEDGLRLWRFREADRMTHAGTWSPVYADPPGAGRGLHLWGIASNDLYATGRVEGQGHMLRYDGTAWAHLLMPAELGTIHGVWGTPQGVVWFSAESGSLVRYQRGNRAPDLTAAQPSVDRLWPDDRRLVRVEVGGVLDPDGDALTIRIDRVTQDEDPVTVDVPGACPDAFVSGNHVSLRAEHAPNGDGRTYVVEFTATDRLGATSRGQVLVCAPHYLTTSCSPDPGTFDSQAACAPPEPQRGPIETDEVQGALRIRYEIEQPARIHLGLYDVAGRLRATISEGLQNAGPHETTWRLDGLESGVYFVKLRTHGPALVRRVIVMR